MTDDWILPHTQACSFNRDYSLQRYVLEAWWESHMQHRDGSYCSWRGVNVKLDRSRSVCGYPLCVNSSLAWTFALALLLILMSLPKNVTHSRNRPFVCFYHICRQLHAFSSIHHMAVVLEWVLLGRSSVVQSGRVFSSHILNPLGGNCWINSSSCCTFGWVLLQEPDVLVLPVFDVRIEQCLRRRFSILLFHRKHVLTSASTIGLPQIRATLWICTSVEDWHT